MRVWIPGRGKCEIDHLVLDTNGTIAVDGALIEGVASRLVLLGAFVRPVVVTAVTHGVASRLRDHLGLDTVILEEGNEAVQKLECLRRLGAE